MSKIPTKFEDLKPTELYRSAIEDFALPVEEADKNKKTVLLAAFLEGGVTWADYVEQHPEVAPDEPVYEPKAANMVASAEPVDPANKWADEVQEVQPEIVVAQPIAATNQKYLIKMVRDNPLFEVRGHRFTTAHPYALVDAKDADYILTKEDGFRQATPSELQEFYG